MKQKDYKIFLGVPLRAEIEQNLSKIKQITTQKIVRFCLDFVRFLAEGDPKPHLKVKTIHFRRSVIYGLFRTALSPVPTSSIGGKVTAE